uniref:Uncharacterized protein n=1 Tax=Desulfomonile tiedjei TaxID=2358 RepID=A0A7C4AQ90_9BACT
MATITKARPAFSYMSETPAGPIECDGKFLRSTIPTNRSNYGEPAKPSLSFHEYFLAIETWLSQNLDNVSDAVQEMRGREASQIDVIKIVAEKHGSDYHPARVIIGRDETAVSLAVNVAVTQRGRDRMESEYSALAYLARTFPRRFIPRVFFSGTQCVGADPATGHQVSLFAAEWYEGFHEFHLDSSAPDPEATATLWDPLSWGAQLDQEELSEIYRQAAYILTYYYNVSNCCEIFPWHHAAGDFVVKRAQNRIDVRLITVRQYAPRIELSDNSPDKQAIAALMFLVNLTLRTRLDRSQGTGDIVWGPERSVNDTLRGFAEALQDQVEEGRLTHTRFLEIMSFLRQLAPAELAEAFLAALASYDPRAPDIPVIKQNLDVHIFSVFKALRSMQDRLAHRPQSHTTG